METKRKLEAIEELKKLIKAIENDENDSLFCMYTKSQQIQTISYIKGSVLPLFLGSIELAKAEMIKISFEEIDRRNEKNH